MTKSTLLLVTHNLQRASNAKRCGESKDDGPTDGKGSWPCADGQTAQCNSPSNNGLATSSGY